jgi:hypothetical protein
MPSKRLVNSVAERGAVKRSIAAGAWCRLTVVIFATAVVWLIILPSVARIPQVAARRAANEARGINPSAMYYTELRAMPALESQLRERIEKQPRALWSLRP